MLEVITIGGGVAGVIVAAGVAISKVLRAWADVQWAKRRDPMSPTIERHLLPWRKQDD